MGARGQVDSQVLPSTAQHPEDIPPLLLPPKAATAEPPNEILLACACYIRVSMDMVPQTLGCGFVI